ncbi:DUF4328 domain-containing protein [Actinosynnema sp. NPDC047251]|uniref:DUF4328 domain-containing protein n=1 Tax=Saccharothrix espanaensis (strain ATCC 51144 / DSM 44229 / JCM 9112 / NBRC 15066 / NRRL 15764) TaxID=1179773 RepID=K0K6J2_SACES|nr:DUF4328 domain-containing protein [Saccharothrix espanaensis]CCH32178.1 hypothetical protein BN6_49080 [Saccharothrix espanaensis DSM 44229]
MFSPVRGLGTALSILVGLYTLANVITAGWLWYFKSTYEDYLADEVTDTALLAVATAGVPMAFIGALVFLSAAVVTIVWLWRVRTNAALANPRFEHRWNRGAAIWGWLPVVNFWVPRRFVLDVWRACAPDQVSARTTSIVNWWWGPWLIFLVLDRYSRPYADPDSPRFDLENAAQLTTAASVLCVAAAVNLIVVVRRITTWQSTPGFYSPPDVLSPPMGLIPVELPKDENR